MSYDFATLKPCSHTNGPELVTINTDRTQFAFPRTPVNDSVSIQIDGVNIPSSGLYSRASLVTFKPEPYRITAGQNDLLPVRVGNGITRIVQLPPGSRVSAQDIVRVLTASVPELSFSVQNHRIVSSTTVPFKGMAFSFPDPRVSDKTESLPSTVRMLGGLSVLGINPGRVASGRKLYPGWKIIPNPAAFWDEYIVLFDEPIFNNSPVITVVYQTVAQLCGRCFGTRLEYDYSVLGQSYETVENTDLLAQELDKFLFTNIGSHWKWRWMGSSLSDRIGGKADTYLGTAAGFVTVDVSNAFSVYQNLKQQQDRSFPHQNVTDAEYPYSLDGVNALTDPNDPTSVVVKLVVKNRSAESVPLTRIVNTPDPFQLTSDPTGVLKNAGGGFRLVG